MICKDWHAALLHTVHGNGMKQYEIAKVLGVSPSGLSRMCCHPEDENRRSFDIQFIGPLMEATEDISLLETWADRLGYKVVAEEAPRLIDRWEQFERGVLPIFKRFLTVLDAAGGGDEDDHNGD